MANMLTRPRGIRGRLHASPQTNCTATNPSICTARRVQTALDGRRPPRELILQQREAMTEIRGSPVQKLETVGPVAPAA